MHRYSPYSVATPSHYYNRQPTSAYASYPTASPSSYGQPSTGYYNPEYTTPYSSSINHAQSWMRTGLYSAYNAYENDASTTPSASNYTSQQQPASFLLPNTNPLSGTANTSYNAVMNPYSRASSQVWSDPNLLSSAYNAPTSTESAKMSYEDHSNETPATLHASAPYQLITNAASIHNSNSGVSIDRTLPTPGHRSYSITQQSSEVDNLPLSAVSHRSSIGWSTDSASGASHVSSQTSLTGSTPGGAEYATERNRGRYGYSDLQDLPYGQLGFDSSPHQTVPNNHVTVSNEASLSYCSDATLTRSATAASRPTLTDGVSSDVNPTNDLPPRQQRCRTISQESTPLQPSNTISGMNESASGYNNFNSDLPTIATKSSLNHIDGTHKSGTNRATGPRYPTSSCPASSITPQQFQPDSTGASTSVSASPRTSYESLNSSRNSLIPSTTEATATIPDPGSRTGLTYHIHSMSGGGGGGGGYTATPHQGYDFSSSSYARGALVIPSSHSQTRGTAFSGMGSARMPSVSYPGLSGYGSTARGPNGPPSSSASILAGYDNHVVTAPSVNDASHGGMPGDYAPSLSSLSQYTGNHGNASLQDVLEGDDATAGRQNGRRAREQYPAVGTDHPDLRLGPSTGDMSTINAAAALMRSRSAADMRSVNEY